ncbi:TPA: hypothetical protein ACJGSB_001150 [Salmonella enterica subsp. enterica serovar Havana]
MLKRALASLEAEPAGYHVIKECGKVGCSVATLEEAEKTRDFWNKKWTIRPYFYSAPPVQETGAITESDAAHHAWNACHTAMLKRGYQMTAITKEWLQQTIAEFENTRDDIPFGLNDDDAKILIVLKRALAVIDAEPVRYLNKFSGTCVTLEQQSNAADDVAVYIPLYAAPPAPAVIQSSQLLHDFYRAYADWLISGGDGQFSCVNGLCANLFDYCDRKGVGSAQALNEMHVQFVTAGMNEKLPFNTSVTDFDAESADGKCHLNTARRKWVFRRIIDGVKPALVVPDE